MISTDNPLVGLFVYIVALDGYCEITVSLNIHAMKLASFKIVLDKFCQQYTTWKYRPKRRYPLATS